MRYKITKYTYRDGSERFEVTEHHWFQLPLYHGFYDTVREAEEKIKDLAGWPKVTHFGRYDKDGDYYSEGF